MMTLKKIFEKYDQEYVWHFTDYSNLNSIEKHGLASLAVIEKEHIIVNRYGADALSHYLDRSMGLDNYVHLAFSDDHPMYYVAKSRGSIQRGVWLQIPVKEVLKDDALFAKKVANKRGSKLYDMYEIANHVDFRTLWYGRDFESRKEARKAEILIPSRIDINKITGVKYGK